MELMTAYQRYAASYRQKYLALYHALREAIVEGRLRPGERLPSSRALADSYGLSRGTVNAAYDLLAGEGYVAGGVGRGTFVCYAPGGAAAPDGREGAAPRLSAWGERMRAMAPRPSSRPAARSDGVDFSAVRTDFAAFPAAEWNRAVYAAARAASAGLSAGAEAEPQGCRPLREAIARHLGRTRGIATTAEHVVIVNGSAQALALLVQLLVDPGDPVVVERPGYEGIRRAVLAAGGAQVYARVDRRGLVPEPWRARLLAATPNRQFPTGAVLPLERRLALLEWARATDAWIVEDDYDSEFRHTGRPVEPLKSLDRDGRVAFVGTFSRTMYTELRLGYAVLPTALLKPFVALKALYEPHPTSVVEQAAMAQFMNGGAYERLLRRMKRLYSRKYETMLQALRERLGHRFETWPQDAGLHIYARWLGRPEAYDALREACARKGVRWSDVSYEDEGTPVRAAVFGFSGLDDERIVRGVEWIAEAEAELREL